MKKSQIIGQVFVYILTIVIFGIILLYGYRAITKMRHRADDVLTIQVQKEMKNAVETTDYGSITKQEISVPNKVHQICFVDLKKSATGPPMPGICIQGHPDYQPLACDSWQSGTEANMFLVQDYGTVDAYYIGPIDIPNSYECIDALQGRVIIRLEGKGKYVELSEWPDI
jgi:hypothetical protein